jgi:hypothetical protein
MSFFVHLFVSGAGFTLLQATDAVKLEFHQNVETVLCPNPIGFIIPAWLRLGQFLASVPAQRHGHTKLASVTLSRTHCLDNCPLTIVIFMAVSLVID